MKYYLFSAGLILLATVFILLTPFLKVRIENSLVSAEVKIPKNNATISGVQKYNRAPLSSNLPTPNFSARAILVKDITSDTILYQKNVSIQLPIASTTKIMTALIATEHFSPNATLTVGAGAYAQGARVGLFFGESLSFRSLLYGLLLNSGNDAAYTIAENYPGGVVKFVEAMNQKAIQLNLINTHFDNPAGFDSSNHFSSATDLVIISEEALKKGDLARIFVTKNTEVLSLDKKYKHGLSNLNKLLSSLSGTLGVKTGYTAGAKENLVGLFERDGHKILTVVLGSDDRFGETTTLVNWVYSNFTWID